MIDDSLIKIFIKNKNKIRDKYEFKIDINNDLNIFSFEKIINYLLDKNNHSKVKSKQYHLYILGKKELIVFNDGSSICLLNKSENNNIQRYKRLPNDEFESRINYDKIIYFEEIIFIYKKWNIILYKKKYKNDINYGCKIVIDSNISKNNIYILKKKNKEN